MNLGNLLSASAARNPRKTACVLENESISYEQLDRSTTSLARWFLRQGCKPGDRIVVHWPNSIETVMLFFACFKAGMIAVPVNVRMKAPEIACVLQHSSAAMYIAHTDLAAVATEARKGCARLSEIHSAHARQRLADFKIPEQIFFVNDLPKGITGKIQRRALKEMTSAAVAQGGVNLGNGSSYRK